MTWPDRALRSLSNLDPVTMRSKTPATDQAVEFYHMLSGAPQHRLRWVMSPDYALQLHLERPPMHGDEDEPDYTTKPTTTMFGIPIRFDDNATTLMLELR